MSWPSEPITSDGSMGRTQDGVRCSRPNQASSKGWSSVKECFAPLFLCRACADMHAFALRAEQREEFDGLRAGAVEPMRHSRVELGHLARSQHQVVLAKHQPQLATEDIEPLI